MNSIVNTQPSQNDKDDPLFRPGSGVKLNLENHCTGTLPRPLLLIGRESMLAPMGLNACKLFDALLGISWELLETAELSTFFRAKGAFLRRQIGQANRRSNDRLDAAFDELMTQGFRLPVALCSDASIEATLIERWEKHGQIHSWRFSPELVALCRHVPLWVKYPVGVGLSLEQPLAHRLHELLCVFANRRWPIWTVPIAELRGLLGCTKADMSDRTFLRRQLRPALVAVAEARSWQVRVDLSPDPQILPPLTIRFTINKVQTARAAAA